MQPCEPRSFRFIELLRIGDWRMKLYGIARRRDQPREQVLEAAKRSAAAELAHISENNYKVGFVSAHDGRDACCVFVDFWRNANELSHRVFFSRSDDPAALSAATNTDSSVCVWDLRLQSFEREAWIKHVLRKPDAPDFDGYLAERLNEHA